MDKELGVLPEWNLSVFFQSADDPKIDEIQLAVKKRAEQFAQQWRGVVNEKTQPTDILGALQEYESIFQEAIKPMHYAHLLHATDSTNARHGALIQKTQSAYTELYTTLIFFELELLQLPGTTLQRYADDKVLENYHHFLVKLLKSKPHRLLEGEEKLLVDLAQTGQLAFSRLFDEELSHKKFTVKIDNSTEEWPEEKVLNLLYNEDREKRRMGADTLTRGLSEDLRRLTFIFNTLGEDKHIRDRYQKYSSPEESRHEANETTQSQVDTMSTAVSEAVGIVSDYYDLKREVLGLEELFDYDRYAPIFSTEKLYAFAEARDVVLDAYGKFSPTMRERAQEFFEKKWIDAETRHGKQGGAFCSFGTPDTHPVVFLNYLGTVKHVLTLAHELGHGVHASLMRRQTMFNFDTPLTIAETASVFGEMLVFDKLRNEMSGKEKFSLYAMKIEELFAVIFRQHAMYKFEQDFHAARRIEGELSSERISQLWIHRQKEMSGSSITLRKEYSIWWSYIPHFLHTPFYVYAYVYGELLVLSLYNQYKKSDNQQEFAEKYVAMLTAGGTKTPEELVAPFGINLESKEFWRGGLMVVKDLVKELKTLA